jgi:hypothetical protein
MLPETETTERALCGLDTVAFMPRVVDLRATLEPQPDDPDHKRHRNPALHAAPPAFPSASLTVASGERRMPSRGLRTHGHEIIQEKRLDLPSSSGGPVSGAAQSIAVIDAGARLMGT